MVSRKSHPKSRNGCAQCKRRRIKCDEKSPRCSNCEKHSIECDFSQNPPNPSISSPNPPRKRGSESSRTPGPKATGTSSAEHSANAQNAGFDTPQMNLPLLHMDDLELLHQFTTETCFTLSDRPESHALWQVTVPQVAFTQSFLMRGILAISSLHLSFLRPDRHDYYNDLANRNQNAALGTLRSLMTNMDPTNCDAFLAMSTLVVVYAFESPKSFQGLGFSHYTGEHAYEWLPLIKGVYTIIMTHYQFIKAGRLSALLHDQETGPPTTELPPLLDHQLNDLEKLCEEAAGNEEDVRMYKGALGSLRACFVKMNNRTIHECEVSIAFLWPVLIPQQFVDKMHAGEPLALIILAHYCVILHHLDSYWWMNGWASYIVRKIDGELDASMRSWLQWATKIVDINEKILTNGAPQSAIQRTRAHSEIGAILDRSVSLPDDELTMVDSANAKSEQL